MGAWGYQNFEDDASIDFVDDFLENPSPTVVRNALLALTVNVENGKHFQSQEYLQHEQCCAALAAAEIVAAARRKPSLDFPEELYPILNTLVIGVDSSMRKLVRKAVRNVLNKSEMRNLWAETSTEALSKWETVQVDLLQRLK